MTNTDELLPESFTFDGLARLLNTTEAALRAHVQRGSLPAIRTRGGRVLIPRDAAAAFAQARGLSLAR
jgi:excisionase family DNA binding protein